MPCSSDTHALRVLSTAFAISRGITGLLLIVARSSRVPTGSESCPLQVLHLRSRMSRVNQAWRCEWPVCPSGRHRRRRHFGLRMAIRIRCPMPVLRVQCLNHPPKHSHNSTTDGLLLYRLCQEHQVVVVPHRLLPHSLRSRRFKVELCPSQHVPIQRLLPLHLSLGLVHHGRLTLT